MMRKIPRIYNLLPLFVILLFSIMGSFHYHEEGLEKGDCNECYIISHLNTTLFDRPVEALKHIAEFCELNLSHFYVIILKQPYILRDLQSRAPPYFV